MIKLILAAENYYLYRLTNK